MKLIYAIILVCFFSSTLLAQTADPPPNFGTVDGSSSEPYEIATLNNLYWLSQTSSAWDKHFIQTADIDAADTENWDSGAGFLPISGTNTFNGSFDGNGFTISNLFINRPEANAVGLFGFVVPPGQIAHISLINVNITGRDYTGSVAGYQGSQYLENSFSSGVVNGRHYVGGLVGQISNSSNNYSLATVNGEECVGGITGVVSGNAHVSNSYAIGNITGQNRIGGFSGCMGSPSIITNSYSAGFVTGITNTGGLIGGTGTFTVNNSFWNTETSGQATSTGGTGLTTSQMRQQSSYSGWDFTGSGPWDMVEGITFPFLRSIPQDPAPGVASEFTAELAGTAEGWRMLTAPTVNATYQELLGTVWTQGFPGADVESGNPNVYWYNEVDRSWNAPNNMTNIVGSGSNSGFINSGRGILVYVYDNHLLDSELSGWPKSLAIENIAPFSDIVVSFSRTVVDPDDGMQGWHLVGNPYPFSINWVDMVHDNALNNVMPPIFIYDANANSGLGGYRVHYGFDIPDLPSGIAHDGIIPPFQAFWSRTTGNSASGTITFRTKYSTVETGTLYGKPVPNSASKPYLALFVKGRGLTESVVLTFDPENTFITERPITLSSEFIEFGFRDDENRIYALQNISPETIEGNNIEIPLVIESTMAGTYTLNAGLLNLPQGIHATIFDSESGTLTDIDRDFEFTFELESRAKSIPSSQALFSTGNQRSKEGGATPRFSLILSPVGITSNEQHTGLPDRIALDQNYPNPFNPTTIIKYQLPELSDVRLEIFDILGRRVGTLVNGPVEAGRHEVRFDAGNLTSGVYIYRLEAGGKVFIKKLTLLK